jgi:hypothetical protein
LSYRRRSTRREDRRSKYVEARSVRYSPIEYRELYPYIVVYCYFIAGFLDAYSS